LSIFQACFDEIEEYTNLWIPNNLGPFQNYENLWYCKQLFLLTPEPHDPDSYWNGPCCSPTLVRALISYRLSGWSPAPVRGLRYTELFFYTDGYWNVWDQPEVINEKQPWKNI
jgi:hypothetical protein